MAENENMHLNHVLCFIFSKLHRLDQKQIKDFALNFYTSVDIHEAKESLMNISYASFGEVEWPTKIIDRRAGDWRSHHELDDIFTVITALDEKQLLRDLPKFVSDSSDQMPTRMLTDGDLKAFMNRFDKMELRLVHMSDIINKLSATILDMESRGNRQGSQCTVDPHPANNSQSTVTHQAAGLQLPLPSRSAVNDFLNEQRNEGLLHPGAWDDNTTGTSSCDERGSHADAGEWQTASGRRKKRRRIRSDEHATFGSIPASFSQSTAAAAGAATLSSSDFPALSKPNVAQSIDKSGHLHSSKHVHQPSMSLKVGYSSAAAKPAAEQTVHRQRATGQQQQQQQRRNQKQVVVGRSRSNATSSRQPGHIAAAKPFISKATFCVDNVATDVTELDMATFVASMDIDVLGCYNVNPRRTRYELVHGITEVKDRKAFRLCIPREDSERLLNPKRWPAHVAVSQWTFKKKTEDGSSAPTGSSHDQQSARIPVSRGNVLPADASLSVAASTAGDVVFVAGTSDAARAMQESTPTPSTELSLTGSNSDEMETTIKTQDGGTKSC